MSRIVPIRIKENDRKEYARLVKNSKAKIKRAKKDYGIDLSDAIELKPLESFSTRKEFTKWKESQSSFTNRANLTYQFQKNDYGVVASKKEINVIARETKKAQRVADELSKDARNKPFISGGKEQGTVGQRLLQMGKPNTAGITRPPDFDFKRIRTREQLELKEKNMKDRASGEYFDKRMEDMKNNFVGLLETAFNSDADNLIEKLDKVSARDFYEMYLMFDEFDFNLYYSSNDDLDDNGMNDLNRMETYIDKYLDGDIDMNLKGIPSR